MVPGLQQQGSTGSYKEPGCVNACDLNPGCYEVDYNTQNQLCYFGPDPNATLYANSVVNHYSLVYC